MGSESWCLHLFPSPRAAAGIDWFPGAPDARGPPAPCLDPAPLCGHLLCCQSPSLSAYPLHHLPAPRPLRPFPPLSLGLRIHPGRCQGDKPIPGKEAFEKEKWGKATRQSSNKGAIKAAPKWRAKDTTARKSASELAITPS